MANNEQIQESLVLELEQWKMLALPYAALLHDVNNILNASIIHLEYLVHDVNKTGAHQEELSDRLTNLLECTKKSRDLTKSILKISRINSTQEQEVMPVTKVVDVINDLVRIVKALMPDNVKLKIEVSKPDLLLRVEERLLLRSLLNICVNSIKSMRGRSRKSDQNLLISVTTAEWPDDDGWIVTKKTYSSADSFSGVHAVVSVHDTGCGMTKEVLDRLMIPFIDTGTSNIGNGLGMYVVKKMVDQCHGHVYINTCSDIGTVVALFIPMMSGDEVESNMSSLTQIGA